MLLGRRNKEEAAALKTLSPTEVSLLTRALSRDPEHPDIPEEARRVKELPQRLRSSLFRLVFFHSGDLAREIGPRLRELISVYGPHLIPLQTSLVRTLLLVHALWLTPDDYRAVHPSLPTVPASENLRWAYQSDRCEGCILARVGGDKEVVGALRGMLLGRRLSGEGRVFLRVVEGWMAGLVDDRVWGWSRMIGKALKKAKASAKAQTTREKPSSPTHGQDYSAEIIDYYAGLAPPTNPPTPPPAPTQFQFSTTRPPEGKHIYPTRHQPPPQPARPPLKHPAAVDARADAYRMPVDDPLKEKCWSDDESQETRWSDFYSSHDGR